MEGRGRRIALAAIVLIFAVVFTIMVVMMYAATSVMEGLPGARFLTKILLLVAVGLVLAFAASFTALLLEVEARG